MSKSGLHQPVMLEEAIDYLQVQPEQWYLDTTFGRGGHTQLLLQKQAKVLAYDFDQAAIEYGQKHFAQAIAQNNLLLIRTNFTQLKPVVEQLQQAKQIGQIQGVLFDFGTTQDQLKSAYRGFSFDQPAAKLDMRMDQRLGVTAADLLHALSVKQLTQLFKEFGGEVQAKKIAQAIKRFQEKNDQGKISQVGQLLKIIEKVKKKRRSHLHPATKVFQALRIAVNSELDNIKQALPAALAVLAHGGRLVTISFHQGEDALAKHLFKEWEQAKQGQIITTKPITPNQTEINKNPAARSAKLRAFQKG